MYKRYLLKCRIMYDSWLGDYMDMDFYFDTEEEMIDFIKNGNESFNPEDIKVECAFELNKIDIEF